MNGRYQLMGVAVLWALLVPVASWAESDPFAMTHGSTPTEARAHCVNVMSECRERCGKVPTSDPSAMKPWEACLEGCNREYGECEAAVAKAFPGQ